jgi:putative ABC transport system ATP-binding protein
MSYIQVENLNKSYGTGAGSVKALQNVGFRIESGEFVGVMGASGSGKSTLLSILGAMNAPTGGVYQVDEIEIYKLHQEKRADFRREFLGFVFQSFHLMPYLTVLENVMLPLTVLNLTKKEKESRAGRALEQVGLADKERRLPDEISGGEKERVAIARAIVNEPPIILADEPTGNLDSKTTIDIMKLLAQLNENGTTIIMVTHNPLCAGYARRILKLSDGMLVSDEG